jgi:hypothetical protein
VVRGASTIGVGGRRRELDRLFGRRVAVFATKQAELGEIGVDGVVLVVVAEVGREQRSGDRLRSMKAVRHGRRPRPGQVAGVLVASPSFQHPEGDGG